MTLGIKYIFRYFLVAPLGIGVSNSNGGKNEADNLYRSYQGDFTKFLVFPQNEKNYSQLINVLSNQL